MKQYTSRLAMAYNCMPDSDEVSIQALQQQFMDAGYCIDAPCLIPAGAQRRSGSYVKEYRASQIITERG